MGFLENILQAKNNQIRKPYGYETPGVIQPFKNQAAIIASEWSAFVAATAGRGRPIDDFSENQRHLNEDKKWKAFFLFIFGKYNPQALNYFPETIKLIKAGEEEIKLVFFSNLEPGKHIPPHRGNNHSVIRSQIGIDIKDPASTMLRVEDKTVQLKNRELFIFDDTFEHEAWNRGQDVRTVLIIDSCKRLPHFYNVLNRYALKKMQATEYVLAAQEKLCIET